MCKNVEEFEKMEDGSKVNGTVDAHNHEIDVVTRGVENVSISGNVTSHVIESEKFTKTDFMWTMCLLF